MYDLIVKNARRLNSGEQIDIACHNHKIVQIGNLCEASATEVIDADGYAILPPFVESHIHLDTALTYGRVINESGSLFEGIQLWSSYKETMTEEDVMERAKSVIHQMVAKGVLFIRVMVDVSSPDMTGFKALLKIKEEVAGYADLQLIAFPQNGILSSKAGAYQLEEALRSGADGVSAVPHLERTREKGIESLKKCFDLAAKHHAFVHIFCDETDDPHSRFIETVSDLAIERELFENVSVSHATAMNYYNASYVQKLLNIIAASKINIVTCPLINTVMQGRTDNDPKGRGITRVKELWNHGVNVACAHDDFMSPFYPFGTGSMPGAVNMLLHLAQMTGADDFDKGVEMMTTNAAKVLALKEYGLKTGNPANFQLIDCKDAHDLIRRGPAPAYVIRNGEIIARTIPEKTSLFLEQADQNI